MHCGFGQWRALEQQGQAFNSTLRIVLQVRELTCGMRPKREGQLLWICAVLLVINASAFSGGHSPDPTVLLKGVEAVRLQLPPSRLVMRAVLKGPTMHSDLIYHIEFDGEKRLYSLTNSGTVVRMVFDGTNVMRFDGIKSVTVRNLDSLTSDYFFDPRVLGITADYAWSWDIPSALRYQHATNVSLVGLDQIGTNNAWHVRVATSKIRCDLWVDPVHRFRVYRFEEHFRNGGYRTSESLYDSQTLHDLPSSVSGTNYNAKGIPVWIQQISILSAQPNTQSSGTWGLQKLGIPLNAEVIDVRSMSLLGYWNGKDLVPEMVTAARLPPPKSLRRALVVLATGAAILLPLFLMLYARRKLRKGGE
jgi:hypothetical protein